MRSTSWIAAVVTFIGFIPAVAAFSDVPADHPYAEAIQYAEEQGIVHGYRDGSYRPDQTINRAEFVKIIVGAKFQDRLKDSQKFLRQCRENHEFSDVAADWYEAYVCIGKQVGIIDGYPDGTFRPAATISFAESAKIIAKALDVAVTSDSTIWYKGHVDALAAKNAIPMSIRGFDQSITRGEMVEMIWRLETENKDLPSQTYEQLAEYAALQNTKEWIPYSNSHGFSFKVPAKSTKTEELSNYIRFDLKKPDEEQMIPAFGEYFLEVYIGDTKNQQCPESGDDGHRIILGNLKGWRGNGGGDSGPNFELCVEDTNNMYLFQVHENNPQGTLANSILDTVIFKN